LEFDIDVGLGEEIVVRMSQRPGTILVVDDHAMNRDMLARRLEKSSHQVKTAGSGKEALEAVEAGGQDVVLLDIMMEGLDGIEVLRRIRRRHNPTELPVIMVTAKDQSEDIVHALNEGANDYVTKPIDFPVLLARVQTQLTIQRIAALEGQVEYLSEQVREASDSERAIIGKSSPLAKVLQQIEMVAPTDAGVLITGESGVGKELIAQAIHERSKRRDRPLIRVNCASIPRELFESEFFGHVKGAFTGAVRDRQGRFQLANGGTLFLDEVGEIPSDLQGKLLRVLQEGQFERIGEEFTRRVDVRIISATNRDLAREVEAKRFRQDLYYRLSVFPIEIPPLRDRREDIPELVRHFLQVCCRRLGIPPLESSPEQLEALKGYDWPGNIRELHNVVERAVITARGGTPYFDVGNGTQGAAMGFAALANIKSNTDGAILTYAELEDIERSNILAALRRTNWKVSGAGGTAELLQINPSTLASRIKAMGIKRHASADV